MAETTQDPKAEKPAKGKRYEALTPINHDGKDYAVGKVLTLTAEYADPLLAVGAIKLAGKAGDEPAESET